ncbi:GNAT family N-acetyltransferase [Litoribacter ruber]|uniref:GNAT family N-acetyltransferase n=1 Tax=Litoribacter ruber TaxID=702568 RepID=A0AAP2G588_9BACT|nr:MULTISPECIES: GNAT family N-acetyltransferase [Litoribacter]MBS9524258.1 GNAT family N-acetyltransferase [Litoribacter alkaliphilus]MBT0809944.1 GNAT family N-acetyltransferase [Litoribacter ruber]
MQDLVSEYTFTVDKVENKGKVVLLTGQAALDKLFEPDFVSEWTALIEACPWATAFQSPQFVNSWYNAYQNDAFPIVALHLEKEKLKGIMTMAILTSKKDEQLLRNKTVKITGAGGYDAEYQTWVSEKDFGNKFALSAIEEIKAVFPKSNIIFRFIPAGAPIEWLDQSEWSKKSVLQPHKRPLLKFENPDSKKAFKINKQYKTKLNRLKREGVVSFEKVASYERFEEVLDDLAVQYDFRQGVMFNKNQFRDFPARKKFMLEMFREGVLHVTLLKLDDHIIGSMGAVYGKDWLHLQGFNTHSPFYAKHSPGILHFLHLGNHLFEEGFEVFDLTPGGDKYKEKMATSHDVVYSLVLTDSLVFKFKRQVKKKLHAYWESKGLRPMSVEMNFEKKAYLFSHRLDLLKKEKLGFFRKKASPAIKPHQVEMAKPIKGICKNEIQDLLQFEEVGTNISRWEYLEAAMSNLEEGQGLFTWSENGVLLASVWIIDSKDKYAKGFPDGLTLIDEYLHPNIKDQYASFLKGCVNRLQEENPGRSIYLSTADGFETLA